MRGFSIISDEERNNILSQHQTVYDGYAVGNVQGNMYPLTVGDYAQDKGGVTVNSKGEVMGYKNHNINESVEEAVCNECGGVMSEGECSECGYMSEQVSMENPQGNPYENEKLAFNYKTGGPEQYDVTQDDEDPYNLDLQAIQNMFDYEDINGNGSEDEDEDMRALQTKMDDEFSGKEKMSGEWSPYSFKSQGGNVMVYERVINENEDSIEQLALKIMLSKEFDRLVDEVDPTTFEDEFEYADNIIYWATQDLEEEPFYDDLVDYIKEQFGDIILSMYGANPFGDDDMYTESVKESKNKIMEMFDRFSKFN